MYDGVTVDEGEGLLRHGGGPLLPFLNFVQEVAFVLDPDTTLRYANPAVERLLGYSLRDLYADCALDYLHPEDRAPLSEALARTAEEPGGSARLEFRWRHKDGTWRTIEAVLVNMLGDPFMKGILCSGRDLTQPTGTEEGSGGTLKELADLKRAVEESAIVVVTDAAGRIVHANKEFCQVSGRSREDLLGRDHSVLVEPGAPSEGDIRALRRTVASGEVWRGELGNRAGDGSVYWVDATVVPLLDEGGEPYRYAAICHDVTERKEAEEALRAAETRYSTLAKQVKEDILLVDVGTKGVLQVSGSPYRSLGYQEEELKELSLYDLAAQDPAGVDADIERAMEGESGFIGERRYRRKDGTLADVEVSASMVPYGATEAVCLVAQDVTERKRTERELQKSLNALLAIYEAGHILGSTLEAEEIGSRLLHLMQRISRSVTAVISLPDERRQLRVWRAIGFENLWRRARFTPQVQDTLQRVLRNGEHALSQVRPPDSESAEEEPLAALFLPLRIRNRTVGVLEVYGPEDMTEQDVLDILLNLTTKAASALENARLYGKLAERERQLRELVGKLLVTHEEERRRVAYEVHDGPTQVAVAAFQQLQAFARLHPPDTPQGREALEGAVELAQRTVRESRQIIANLRPTVLDDFGLATAIRSQVEGLRAEGWRVSYETNLEAERLPVPVESALYRVAQEALVNVRKHACTARVRLRLTRLRAGVRLQVRDFGIGMGAGHREPEGPGERVGLAGMRERVALVGGGLKIHSKKGVGTLITADVPLLEGATDAELVRRLASAEPSTGEVPGG